MSSSPPPAILRVCPVVAFHFCAVAPGISSYPFAFTRVCRRLLTRIPAGKLITPRPFALSSSKGAHNTRPLHFPGSPRGEAFRGALSIRLTPRWHDSKITFSFSARNNNRHKEVVKDRVLYIQSRQIVCLKDYQPDPNLLVAS